MSRFDKYQRQRQCRQERFYEKVGAARSRVLAAVSVFVMNGDEHNRGLLKKTWAKYEEAQKVFENAARRIF